jgi:hypothetical protein
MEIFVSTANVILTLETAFSRTSLALLQMLATTAFAILQSDAPTPTSVRSQMLALPDNVFKEFALLLLLFALKPTNAPSPLVILSSDA